MAAGGSPAAHAGLRPLLLLPQTQPGAGQQQALLLALGRLLVVTGCDAELSQLALPLLADPLTCGQPVLQPRAYECLLHMLAQVRCVLYWMLALAIASSKILAKLLLSTRDGKSRALARLPNRLLPW